MANSVQGPPVVIARHSYNHADGSLLENVSSDAIPLTIEWVKRSQMGATDFVIEDNQVVLSVSPVTNVTFDGYSANPKNGEGIQSDEYWVKAQCKHQNNGHSGNWLVLHVRSSPDGSKRTFYRLQLRMTDGAFLIRRFVDGAEVGIASGNVGQVPADTFVELGFHTKIDESGDVLLEGFYNGALILSAVDSDVNKITARGLPGISAICGGGANQVVKWRYFKFWAPG